MRRLLPPLFYCCSIALIASGCAQSTPFVDGEGGSNGSGGNSSGTGGNHTGTGGSGTGGSGTGGNSTGGNTGTGGSVTGTGGSHTGGTTGTGGSGGHATGGSTGAGGGSGSCTVTLMAATPSTKISTVGIVTFTTSLSKPTEGHIDFGLDTTYGMEAPVDFTQTSNKTLLLGMKASKTYHFNISVTDGSNTCTSGDQMITTGALPNGGLPPLTITPTTKPAGLYGGFLVTGSYSGSKYQSFILDGDGDFVWFYNDGADGCGTRMSYDGQYMWMANGNVPATNGSTHVHRVTMDGMTDDDFSTAFANESHQILPLPDGSVAFYALPSGQQCDDIKIFPAGGTTTSTAKTLVNAQTAHGGKGACHCNNIEYDASDDSLVFSDLDNVCLTKVSRTTGSTTWVMDGINGVTSTFTGDLWAGGEHGFHIISPTDYLIFNNNSSSSGGTGKGSIAIELTVDATAKKVTKKWSYTANPTLNVMVLGDVQRMLTNGPGGAGMGNTIVDYGTGNAIQEVDANGNMLQQIKSQYPFGFMEKRFSLYGKPTR